MHQFLVRINMGMFGNFLDVDILVGHGCIV
jgi:hypothetical protein